MDLHNRFTDRVRDLMRRADREAHRSQRRSIDTEHVLLGLVGDESGVAANVLRNLGLNPAKIAVEVEILTHTRTGTPVEDQLPRAASVERVIEYAMDEARNLNHDYVGTEHILLGLLCEKTGMAARGLTGLGLSLEAAREETLRLLSQSAVSEALPYTPGIPVSDADRKFFVRVYQSAVDFYKPRIEKRTEVQLGGIAVWDYSQLLQDVMQELKRQSSPWLVGIFRSLALRRRLRLRSKVMAESYADNARKCGAAYFRSGIYVSFQSWTAHENWIAQGVVHELSHAL